MTASATPAVTDRIKCEKCGALIHAVKLHLAEEHPEMTVAAYEAAYPGAPLLSPLAEQRLKERKEAQAKAAATAPAVSADTTKRATGFFHELFGLGTAKEAMNSKGNPIKISMVEADTEAAKLVPALDPNYVFNIDVLKTLVMGIEMRIPTYLWGHAGTGKTTIIEQICARTGRPMFRVQHTANMEEEHVVGGWRLRDGHTHFELGPLPLAMKMGWLYLADEYDFGRPEVTSLYQAVLENRVIQPHPNFRFIATGNTNGQGDETGLYQGTSMGNAANFERFGIVEKMPYMDPKLETALVSAQAKVPMKDAAKLVDFAGRIRTEYQASKMGNPISPRSLIYAAQIGVIRSNYKIGLEKAFINRLTEVDRKVASELAQRVFGA
jgi:cobaltochelatase CobS